MTDDGRRSHTNVSPQFNAAAAQIVPAPASRLSRRRLLGLGAIAASLAIIVKPAQARWVIPERRVTLLNPYTGETFAEPYWVQGQYLPSAMSSLQRMFRDTRTGIEHEVDPRLFDILHDLRGLLGTSQPFHFVSGYRTPQSNAQARMRGGKVARNSYHLHGMAVDIRVPGYSVAALKAAAISLKAGGVGTYRGQTLLHVDTGPVRVW